LEAIEKLVGEHGLYPSRSELIRCAVRKFLIKELKQVKSMTGNKPKKDLDENKFVQVPIEKEDESSDEPVREFKTYKIVRKLEF
jgi:Arc/MetJ-type ribon-helix-helix transcriptional regulator